MKSYFLLHWGGGGVQKSEKSLRNVMNGCVMDIEKYEKKEFSVFKKNLNVAQADFPDRAIWIFRLFKNFPIFSIYWNFLKFWNEELSFNGKLWTNKFTLDLIFHLFREVRVDIE